MKFKGCDANGLRGFVQRSRFLQYFLKGGAHTKVKLIQIISIFLLVTVFLTVASAPPILAKGVKIGVLMPLTGYIAFWGGIEETASELLKSEEVRKAYLGGS
jgi:hypothetical protein